jgi:hypothetical protein
MTHKSHSILQKELESAKRLVKVNGIYSHYKNPNRFYRVISIGVQESTDELCVIYQDMEDNYLFFVRNLDLWLKNPDENVERFKLIK